MGYPTQKPIALLERIISASSNEGDVVLDPFCGCATALIAAEKLGRQWVGIDLSPVAKTLVQRRMAKELGFDSLQAIYRDDTPKRTDMGLLPPYQTHKHTLFGMQEGICAGCKVLFPFRNFTIDHSSEGQGRHRPRRQLAAAMQRLQLREGDEDTGGVPGGAAEQVGSPRLAGD